MPTRVSVDACPNCQDTAILDAYHYHGGITITDGAGQQSKTCVIPIPSSEDRFLVVYHGAPDDGFEKASDITASPNRRDLSDRSETERAVMAYARSQGAFKASHGAGALAHQDLSPNEVDAALDALTRDELLETQDGTYSLTVIE